MNTDNEIPMATLVCPNTTVLYTHEDKPEQFKAGIFDLLRKLPMETEWNTVVVAGPDSPLQPGDEILMSARPASYDFEIDGTHLKNTSDASIIAFRRNATLGVSGKKTIIYSWLDPEDAEVKSAGGIILSAPQTTTRWAIVHAAGELTGVKAGDHMLIAREPASTSYTLKIEGVGLDGIELHNAGEHEPICMLRPDAKE